MSTVKEYGKVTVECPMKVALFRPQDIKFKWARVFVLMGPTGSGKSAFIEKLSSDGSFSAISKDTLESVTRHVICYRLLNLIAGPGQRESEHIMMDTPGFLDTKLSEARIMSMITQKLEDIGHLFHTVIVHLCYFQPITDIRMGASKRGAITMLRVLAKLFNATHIHVNTTMWNWLLTAQQIEAANRRFASLETDIFRKYGALDPEMHLTKFYFTKESALSFINSAIGTGLYNSALRLITNSDPQFQSMHRHNLLERITNTCQKLQFLAEDKEYASIPGKEDYHQLQATYNDEKIVFAALKSFLDDLLEIDPKGYARLRSNLPLPPPPSPLPLSMGLLRYRFGRLVGSVERVVYKH